MKMEHKQKCEYIHQLSQKFQVISEVGSKDASVHIDNATWIESMESELKAGAFKVIAEARESGTVGIFDAQGKAENRSYRRNRSTRSCRIYHLGNTTQKTNRFGLLKKFGANVNLGNIASNEVIALETLRLGLRGDTFFTFLPDELQKFKL